VRTYRELFGTAEFKPFLASFVLQNAATTVSGLALATLVFGHTASPLLSALAMFGPAFAQLAGAATLLSAADLLRPRSSLVVTTVVFAVATAAQALPGLPLPVAFGILFVQGMVASLGAGVRLGLLRELLPAGGYVLGRSVTSMSGSVMQIAGYAAGAGLVLALAPQGTLLVGAALFLASALAALGLRKRAARSTGRGGVVNTVRTNRILLRDSRRRPIMLALWVPNGLIVGAESLFVSLSPGDAGLLFSLAAAGTLLGSIVVGRFVQGTLRERLAAPLRLLLAVPYLAFILDPRLPVMGVLVFVASIGFAASLLLQEQLLNHTPRELTGHALGLVSSGVLAAQGIGALLAGLVAEATSPVAAISVMAVLSTLATVALAPRLRPEFARVGRGDG
jgi:MFS family permease